MDSIYSRTLDYEVSTFSANVDAVTLELKKNSDGTYSSSNVDLATEGGSVKISETNYTMPLHCMDLKLLMVLL